MPVTGFIGAVLGFWRNGRSLFLEQKGATTAEYALVLALVVVALIGALSALGTELSGKLAEITRQIAQ